MSEPELSKAYEPTQVEATWNARWLEGGYFHADEKVGRPPYCIVIPPPNVTGSLHMGHALMCTIQDVLVRWRRMQGHDTLWLPGTDHAGIATQIMVEKELRKQEGKSRHDLGRDKFLSRVWAWKHKHGDRIVEQMKLMGFSLDWSRMRFTMDPDLGKAVTESFVRLYEEKLIYRARRLINWDPVHQTALSDLEVDSVDEKGSLWEIAYPVVGSDERVVVATTRPETMLGDTAVAVHPDDPRFKHLIGKKLALPLCDREIPVIGDATLVSMEFGTGAVKVTPAHDFNDFATGLRHNLPQISILDLQACITAPAPAKYHGMTVPKARKAILEDLEAAGLLVGSKDHTIPLSRSQRSGAVVEPMLSMQWFVKIEPLAKKAIAAVESGETTFVPEHWTKTYMHWMTNIQDWCISRQLWWGHRIPAWHCQDCEHSTVARETVTKCEKCGSAKLAQDDDVLDTWFSSALWPFSTLGWPDNTDDLKRFYPTTVMETGHDIIFFWVARMMMMGIHFMGKAPFSKVYLHSMVVDEKGDKMSKTKGNVIDPLDVVRGATKDALLKKAEEETLDAKVLEAVKKNVAKNFPEGIPAAGSDALRFTLAAMAGQGRAIKLALNRIEGYRHFANKIWNASRFAMMNLDGFDAKAWSEKLAADPKSLNLSLQEKWFLSRLQSTVTDVDSAMEEFRLNDAAQAIYSFAWRDLCDWLIELEKRDLGDREPANAARRQTAQGVLCHGLETTLRLLHPFMPFITEEIWAKLPRRNGDTAVLMIMPYPKRDERLVDAESERQMELLVETAVAIRNLRAEYNISPAKELDVHIKVTQPAPYEILKAQRVILEQSTRTKCALIAPGAAEPAIDGLAARTVMPQGIELILPLGGIVDPAAEKARMEREIAKAEKDIALLDKKLGNADFVARAPAEVVEEQRTRLNDERTRVASLQAALKTLSKT